MGCSAIEKCKTEWPKKFNSGTEAGWLKAYIKAVEAKPAAVLSTYSTLYKNILDAEKALYH